MQRCKIIKKKKKKKPTRCSVLLLGPAGSWLLDIVVLLTPMTVYDLGPSLEEVRFGPLQSHGLDEEMDNDQDNPDDNQ